MQPQETCQMFRSAKNGPTVLVWGVVNCYSSNTHYTDVLFVAGLTKVLETSKRKGFKLLGITFNRDLTFKKLIYESKKLARHAKKLIGKLASTYMKIRRQHLHLGSNSHNILYSLLLRGSQIKS